MVKQVQGVIHGKTIELDQRPGIAEGQRVDVQVRYPRRHGLGEKASYDRRASPRMLPGFDEAFEQVQRDRESATMRDIEE